ncbi:MAG: TIGR03759 family integrating conjugative element protein [Candidatus Accumulibacter sp.]|jgi:integrating conjugative element protein (TIGR03759 family)|nr:TIGR03759 family integrating conjugative element protein [Accumulibacter sp.]
MKFLRFIPMVFVALLPALALAQMPTVSDVGSSTIQHSSDERQANDWGLRPDEWTRYRQLMQGPLGIHSPNLDPLTALGIEARDDEERTRYAELQVRAEARRVEKMLAYQRAYDAAWLRLFPGLPRVHPPGLADPGEPGRLAVFVKPDCPPCEARTRKLQSSGAAFDLYLVDSQDDDARLRQWARKARIDPVKVRSRAITLNHDSGRWQALGVSGDLPAVLREVNGQWRRQ